MSAITLPAIDRFRSCAIGLAAGAAAALAMPLTVSADDHSEVSGIMTANGVETALPYVYIWQKEGFYEKDDPTWHFLFVEREVAEREIDDPVWDAAWVEIGITQTKGSSDEPTLEVYTQSIKLAADAAGNISGGPSPEFEIEGLGTDRISGRIYLPEMHEFFDDKYQYDFTFTASLSDPNAPLGEVLPEGGGEPGLAYLKWVEVIHAGDLEALKTIVPVDIAEQIAASSAEEAKEQIEFMQATTPKDVKIVRGSSEGDVALLEVEGTMDGEAVSGEIEMNRMGDFWIPTKVSM